MTIHLEVSIKLDKIKMEQTQPKHEFYHVRL